MNKKINIGWKSIIFYSVIIIVVLVIINLLFEMEGKELFWGLLLVACCSLMAYIALNLPDAGGG